MIKKVRVRFAPSPTGPLHIGGVRTALFNYLFAKQNDGDFILRIEDTDAARFVPGAEDYIIEAFKWCGITFDEGVGIGGPHAPYRQSERKHIYLQYAEQLVASGHAYYAFDKPEELDAMRKTYELEGKTFIYNHELREKLQTSLQLSIEEVDHLKATSNNWVIRFKVPINEQIRVEDMIRETVSVNSNTLDDKVLWKKADELPTYHLANIVDDHLMEISHVIRGEEWLPSLPLHALLYRALGWQDTQPQFAHLSLLLKPDGKGKLSKRDGDRLGFPVFPLEWPLGANPSESEVSRGYREDGYFPEAFVNMLALLGWNAGTEQEIFSMDELVRSFDLKRVIKSGARFNPDKARWFNQQYMKTQTDEDLARLYLVVLQEKGINSDIGFVAKVCSLIKDRAVFVSDFWSLSSFFFVAPQGYDEKAVKKFWKEDTSLYIKSLASLLQSINPFNVDTVEPIVHQWIAENQLPMGQVMNAFRISVVGASIGPNMFEIASIIGKDETLRRLEQAITRLSK